MRCAILIAVIYLLSPSVINAKKGNEDENWIDPFYMDSKTDAVANDWMDPLDLEDHKNSEKALMKSSTDNEIKELRESSTANEIKELRESSTANEIKELRESSTAIEIKELREESINDKLSSDVENTEKNAQINGKTDVSTNMLGKNGEGNTEMESKAKNLEKEQICRCEKSEMERNFLQRFISLLVNICFDENNELQKKITVTLEISREELKQLQRLKDNNDFAPAIRLLNTIISDMKFNDHEEDHSSVFHRVLQLISSKEVWMEIAVISFAILPSCLFILGGRITRIICITVLMTFSLSYYGTYRFLRMKAKEKNERILSSTLTCTPEERSWYHNIFPSNSDSECQRRWNALHIDPSIEVTPINVISHMIGVITFQPLEQFGVTFSGFSSQIFDSQPLLRGMVVYSTAVMIIIIAMFFCCYGIHNRSRGHGSHNYPYTYTGHQYCDADSAASSLHPRGRNQMYNPRERNCAPGLSYDALPQQPVYIITNYTDRVPKNAGSKNVKVKPPLHGKGENSGSKKKSGRAAKRNAKNSCIINDDTVPSGRNAATDDET